MDSCRHAQAKKVKKVEEDPETLLTVVHFVEHEQKGNVTVARQQVSEYKKEYPLLHRV